MRGDDYWGDPTNRPESKSMKHVFAVTFLTLLAIFAALVTLVAGFHLERDGCAALFGNGALLESRVSFASVLAASFVLSRILVAAMGSYFNAFYGRSWWQSVFSLTGLLRSCLIAIGFTLVAMTVAGSVDNPGLTKLVTDRQAAAKKTTEDRIERLNAAEMRDANAQAAAYARQRQDVQDVHLAEIARLRTARMEEMGNYGENRVWKGDRYEEFDRLLVTETERLSAEVNEIAKVEAKERTELTQRYATVRVEAEHELRSALAEITSDKLRNHPDAQHPYILALTTTVNRLFGSNFDATHMTLLAAVLVAFIVELTPWLVFSQLGRLAGAGVRSRANVEYKSAEEHQFSLPVVNPPWTKGRQSTVDDDAQILSGAAANDVDTEAGRTSRW
jgi:hypothetical protein